MLIGYARISTQDQTLDQQKDALQKIGCTQIFTDTASGSTTERPGLHEAVQFLRAGDVLVVWRLDRLGRSLQHLLATIGGPQQRSIGFKSLTENIDTTTPGGKLIFHVFGALAEFEHDLIRERTQAGLIAARARGKCGGRPMRHFPGDRAHLGYHLQYVVDGGKARIILAVRGTPASVMDNAPMLDLARWVRTRWNVKLRIVVGDTKFGTIPNIVGLESEGIRAYLPMTDFSEKTGLYPAKQFQYDAERDVYVCPQGQVLKRYAERKREEVILYRVKPKVCNSCPVKAQCTNSKSGRHIFRSIFQDYIDRVRGYVQTEEFQKALRKRQVWVEPLFGEAKQWHQGARARWRGLHKVNIQGVFTAAGQNLKRWLQWKEERLVREAAKGTAILFLWIRAIECESLSRSRVLLFQHAGSLDDVQFCQQKCI